MFTGLIEEVGHIASVEPSPDGSRIRVSARTVLEGARIGDSLAADGVCTTVVALDPTEFEFEASRETLAKTTFARVTAGDRVNLERPLTPNSRIGGHFVTGHVDGVAVVVSNTQDGIGRVVHFRLLDPALSPFLVEKGSVAVNGVSLTINRVEGPVFSVTLIPHTLGQTTLDDLGLDHRVNLETDLLSKTVARLLSDGVKRLGNSRIHTGVWFNLEPSKTVQGG